MFNNFLSNLIFGTNNYASNETNANVNDDVLKANEITITMNNQLNTNNNVNTSISNNNDEFDLIDRKDIDWVLVNPFDQNGNYFFF